MKEAILAIGGYADHTLIPNNGEKTYVTKLDELSAYACNDESCCPLEDVCEQEEYRLEKIYFQHEDEIEFYVCSNITPRQALEILMKNYSEKGKKK